MKAFRTISLILLALTLLFCAACAGKGGSSEDYFNRSLNARTEHTFKEGDEYYVSVLFPNSDKAVYVGRDYETVPYIADLGTGERTQLKLCGFRLEDTEAMLRNSIVTASQRKITLDQIEDKEGMDLFTFGPDRVRVVDPCMSLTSAESRFRLVYINGGYLTNMAAALDPDTGILYGIFPTEGGRYFEPFAAYGKKLVGRTHTLGMIGVFDAGNEEYEEIDFFGKTGYTSSNYTVFDSLAYLGDGSICAVLYTSDIIDDRIVEHYYLVILREDGGSEQYDLGIQSNAYYRIISGDPSLVIVSGENRKTNLLVDRKAGEVKALDFANGVVTAKAFSGEEASGTDYVRFIDLLPDGKTIVYTDGNSLILLRPDTLETKRVLGAYDVMDGIGSMSYPSGNRRGSFCFIHSSREKSPEFGVKIVIEGID